MKKFVAGLLLSSGCIALHAQQAPGKFADADAVYTNLSCEVNIKLNNGKLSATSEYAEDLRYQTGNSIKMMSRGTIYHSSFNQLNKWDAYTKLPDEKKKLKIANTTTGSNRESYIFYDDVQSTSFDFTGGAIGATRHIDYLIENKDAFLLSPFYFERYFPIEEGELRVVFPSDVKLKYILKGLNSDKIKITESKKKDKTTLTFHISDEPGVVTYPDAPDNAYYATHVIFYVEQYQENGEWKNFLSSPDDLYRHCYKYVENINTDIGDELKKIADSITVGCHTEKEIAGKIYKWVQASIKYVAFEDGMEGFVPREAKLVCSRRFGDCKDMASILTAMLRYKKLQAFFTWIGTRDIPYDYTEVPLPIVDNHMISTVKIGDEYIFLDGTDDGCIYGMPPPAIQGKQALLSINANEYKIIRVPVIPKENNVLIDSTFLQVDGKSLKGSIKVEVRGYYASRFHSVINYKTDEEKTDFLKSYFGRASNKIKYSNWQIKENANFDTIVVTANLELPDYMRQTADEFYLNLNLFKMYEHEEIDFPKRKIPIQNTFMAQTRHVTTINVPQGYTASYVPKSDVYENKVWGYKLKYASDKKTVSLTQEFETNHLMLYPDQFEDWNKVLEHLFPNYKQTVAFHKN